MVWNPHNTDKTKEEIIKALRNFRRFLRMQIQDQDPDHVGSEHWIRLIDKAEGMLKQFGDSK